MKILILILTLSIFTGCTNHTPYGKCVGLNGHEDPKLVYEYSANNLVWGIIGFEVLAPPIFVLLDELKCPIGVKNETKN